MKNRTFFLLILIVLITTHNTLLAQLSIEWEHNFGGANNDGGSSVIQTNDGGYLIAGGNSYQVPDGYYGYFTVAETDIIKLDVDGNLEWHQNDGSSSSSTYIKTIIQASDGNYVFSGTSSSLWGDGSSYVIRKIDTSGNTLWGTGFGGKRPYSNRQVIEATDGGYILVGHCKYPEVTYDIILYKVDIDGNYEWTKYFGDSYNDYSSGGIKTIDGGYIIIGYSYLDDGTTDAWVFKIDAIGNLIWEKNFGGSDNEILFDIAKASDGNFILSGRSKSNDGDLGSNYGGYDSWIIKIDENGNLIWSKNYGDSNDNSVKSIKKCNNGSYILLSSSSINGDNGITNGQYDSWIIKIDESGNLIWEENFGGSSNDYSSDIVQTLDGGYIVTGRSYSNDGDVGGNNGLRDIWTFKLSPDNSCIPNIVLDNVVNEGYYNATNNINSAGTTNGTVILNAGTGISLEAGFCSDPETTGGTFEALIGGCNGNGINN